MDNFPELTLPNTPEDNALKEHLKWRYFGILIHQKKQLRTKIRSKKK